MEGELPAKEIKLNNGLMMPTLGMGTAGNREADSLVRAIVELGYRHLDCASHYSNEEYVGQALHQAQQQGINRDSLFITSKIWHTQWVDPQQAIQQSLQRLQLQYLDLYLIHWPFSRQANKPLHVMWREMEDLVDKGLTKSIGVSNMNVQLLWDLLSYARIKPVCNQIELNPQCVQGELVRFLIAQQIVPVAATPVARPGANAKQDPMAPANWPDLRQNEYLQQLANKYNKTVVQIMLNWGLCRGCVVIPKAMQKQNQLDNIQIYDFVLQKQEVDAIEAMDKRLRLWNKMNCIDNADFFA